MGTPRKRKNLLTYLQMPFQINRSDVSQHFMQSVLSTYFNEK